MKLLATIVTSVLLCNSVCAIILLDDTMPKDVQKKTGVANLTARQKLALENWLNDTFVLKNEKPASPVVSVSQNFDGGKKISLTDGTMYEIAPEDLLITSLWITPVPIVVSSSNRTDYPLNLTNQNTGESVRARRLSPTS
jgi:hypothetical protein